LAGIYIHIPFCSQFCTYCDFYSVKNREKKGLFIDALKIELERRAPDIIKRGESIETIYFGGGTPSQLSSDALGEILDTIYRLYIEDFPVKRTGKIEPEITIEVNPDDMTLQFAQQILGKGFNRLSIGVQSFNNEHLDFMNRRHNAEQAVLAFKNAREAGFKNISIDLIFGFEALTRKIWLEALKKAIDLNPEHISAYQLSVEPGTTLHKLIEKGKYNHPADSESLEQYLLLQRVLKGAGYIQYEISSFAMDGAISKHNSNYWNFTPYYGFGPSAHSFDGVRRYWNCSSLARYLTEVAKESRCKREELLTPVNKFNEYIMLSLRQTKGIEVQMLNDISSFGVPDEFFKALSRHLKLGNLVEKRGYIKIPPKKFFFSDGIIRDLFI